ncbi:hypothetical protein SAMN05880590_102771 [Rhizobium sp. RU35A]|uniref:hypothetical protein n=1 Tax=Rhizobium sp. RU35A TaxID=1907414 RepID=UPI0009564782|nr:hypothetical protein [Rhizobium sp. RU35A]SIQ24533.1 hypothetical protein SAMN05880590_102771 [Rhizobium sp. RU35A]
MTETISNYARGLAKFLEPHMESGLTLRAEDVRFLVKAIHTIRALGIEIEQDHEILKRRILMMRGRKVAPVLDGRTGTVIPFPPKPGRRFVVVNPGPDGGDAA